MSKLLPQELLLSIAWKYGPECSRDIGNWINSFVVEVGNTTTINEPSEEHRAYAREHYSKAAIHDLAKTLVKKYSLVTSYEYAGAPVEKITRRVWALAPQGIASVEATIVPLIEDNS